MSLEFCHHFETLMSVKTLFKCFESKLSTITLKAQMMIFRLMISKTNQVQLQSVHFLVMLIMIGIKDFRIE